VAEPSARAGHESPGATAGHESPSAPAGRESPAPPAWVLLRGLTRDSRHWGAFRPLFERAVAPARVIALDLPGNGARHRDASPMRVEAMAEAARAELARHGVGAPVRLLAMSLGAMVATAWAAAHPHEVDALVLINTSLRPFSPWWQRLRPSSYARLLRIAKAGADATSAERAVLASTSRRPPPDALLADWSAWRRATPVAPANALRQLVAAARFRAPPHAPVGRVLLLASERDALVDPRCSQRLAAQWRCPILCHPDAGHDLTLDDAPWVAARAAAFAADAA